MRDEGRGSRIRRWFAIRKMRGLDLLTWTPLTLRQAQGRSISPLGLLQNPLRRPFPVGRLYFFFTNSRIRKT